MEENFHSSPQIPSPLGQYLIARPTSSKSIRAKTAAALHFRKSAASSALSVRNCGFAGFCALYWHATHAVLLDRTEPRKSTSGER